MIGDLKTRLGIYTPSITPDDLGGASTRWNLLGDCWAHIEPRNSTERRENGRAAVLQTYRITIRYRRDIPERTRLLWDNRTLRVISVSDPDLRKERLHIICEEEAE